ncbi:pyridoxine/pyridoxamine 5'-phosphate oxidase [Streptomyces cavernae]|uniref:pyridoxine/pyridoxamine 5'-phosphate oxidase n=1 Tax=Streptomyces cavernae TaxID=2259034 RepID=UPI000FEBDBD9|nr:pyridoxal 5'-phosphate synthase [Streptomyces cavernae]
MDHDLDALLRTQKVWDTELPEFDPSVAPEEPLALFAEWFAAAVAAGQTEPHTMALATVDEEGAPDVRTVMLHGADASHGWSFATHSTSRKGRQLAADPRAALHFYWAAQARQIRLRGTVATDSATASRADLRARSLGALASALVGRQSEVLSSLDELHSASDAAWQRAQEEPDAAAPSWTLYHLHPTEAEFFQGDARRRHVRLNYRKVGGVWRRELLWP